MSIVKIATKKIIPIDSMKAIQENMLYILIEKGGISRAPLTISTIFHHPVRAAGG